MLANGNPVCFHPSVGERGVIAERMRYRYYAKLEYIRAQARQMIQKTLHNRTRKMNNPKVGEMVFFWRDNQHKKKQLGSRWLGPGFIVGHQDSNVWITCGGRCFLVAVEHVRSAVGEEERFGDPETQKTLALLKRIGDGDTVEDLTKQNGPPVEDVPSDILVEQKQVEQNPAPRQEIPRDVTKLARGIGWHKDSSGNPVRVDKHAVAFRTPIPNWTEEQMPFRTTWGSRKGKWFCFEENRRWGELMDPHEKIPQGKVDVLVTIFQGKTRKFDDDQSQGAKAKVAKTSCHAVHMVKATQSKNQLKKMLEKEIPFEKIPQDQLPMYMAALEKEWSSWKQYDSCEVLSREESRRVEDEERDRILPSRFVFRNKHAGLKDPMGNDLPVKPKARLCLQGHLCPDSQSGQLQVDSPTVERVSTMMFLHHCISLGWWTNWYIGDISNAFLQGAPLTGKVMYMRQPKQGLTGLKSDQLLKLLKPVYGRPDAPRAWFNELSRVLTKEIGFTQSIVDPASFHLRDSTGKLSGLLIVHVDDVMVAVESSDFAQQTVERLNARFPFGSWQKICEEKAGVSYCGKEIKLHHPDKYHDQHRITLGQDGFIDGRLEQIKLSRERAKQGEEHVTDVEKTDFRSVVGSLQWLVTQSRPDLAFQVNQLQKRIADLRVRDLLRANSVVKDAYKHRQVLEFHNLGDDVEILAFHDASLFNSVGVEIEDREEADVLLQGNEKRLVYSQKGAMIGLIKRGSTATVGERVRMNVVDWRSSTNKRVVESSLSAETHAAIMAHGLARYCQAVLLEMKFGQDVITAFEDEDFQEHTPMNMVTDCKSIYDHINKDGQHVSSKGDIISVVLLRKMLSTRNHPGKARLFWVPTRHQLADGLTKGGKSHEVRNQLGWALLHEKAAPRAKQSVKAKKRVDSV